MSVQVKALFEFCFQVGDVIQVVKKDDAGWWEGDLNGRRGLFPANYVEEVKTDNVKAEPPKPTITPKQITTNTTSPATTINNKPPHNPFTLAANTTNKGPPPKPIESELKPNPVFGMKVSTFDSSSTSAPASSSSSAGPIDRKPAGYVRGGAGDPANKKIRLSSTKFGLWASNVAYYTGFVMMPMGILSILWHGVDGDNHGFINVITGVYSFLIGMAIIWYESTFGSTRGTSRIPLRGVVYLGLSIFMFFGLATAFCGAFLLLAAILNFTAVLYKESYDAPDTKRKETTADLPRVNSFCEGMFAWATIIRQQNKTGAIVFMGAYIIGNVALFGWTVNHWVNKNASFPPALRISDWGPWAKGFGSLLDLNCAIIVLPVSRTLLRMLYNRSTADQGWMSRTLRAILNFIPLDQNITFHKIIAWVILFAACGHVTLHFINLAFSYDNTLNLFGEATWITGAIILFCMMIIYSATPENTRRGQFEIFWYSHHVFVLFFIFILVHGKGGINPHYWMYAIPTMTIYAIERLLRIYRASLPVSILSVTLMDDVLSLEFAKEGVFENEDYKEGQYLFLQSPPLSRIQWHPFTISSAPQENSVTVHIRVLGEGSWTRGLMQYMATMMPRGKNHCTFDRIGPSGKIPGKIVGPDGRNIIKIDGPHSAPTQHIGEYSTVFVVGAGIGATPLSSTLKSIVFHKWRIGMGEVFPAHAYFAWVCAHRDIDAFRWLIRTVKEAQDELVHQKTHHSNGMSNKTFEFHIFLTSAPNNPTPIEVVVDDAIGFWGPEREANRIEKVKAKWDEIDLYKAMKCPTGHTQLGDVHIWSGRPKWNDRFQAIAAKHAGDIGVAFCGNPLIAKDLRKQCYYSNKKRGAGQGLFKLHKENF